MIPYIDKIPLHTLSWIKTLEKINYDQKYHLFIIHEDKDIDLVFNKLKINKIPNLIYFGKSNTIDNGYQVFKDNKRVNLTKTEYGLLHLLLSSPNKIFNREELLNRVWDSNTVVTDRTVDVHIAKLRIKIETDSKIIQTHHGRGYSIEL